MSRTKYVPLEKRRELRSKAMPEVKRLVKKFGSATIQNCLANLRAHDKTLARISALRKEAAELEKAI